MGCMMVIVLIITFVITVGDAWMAYTFPEDK